MIVNFYENSYSDNTHKEVVEVLERLSEIGEVIYDKNEKRLNDFKLDWCYEPVEGKTDEEVQSKGYIWNENLQLFCMLTEA